MGRRGWHYVIRKERRGFVVYKRYYDRKEREWKEEKVGDLDKVWRKVFACPKCGALAGWYVVMRGGYIYLKHGKTASPVNEKHMWYFSPQTPETEEALALYGIRNKRQRKELTPRELEAIRKVYISKKKASRDERELAKKALRVLLSAKRVRVVV